MLQRGDRAASAVARLEDAHTPRAVLLDDLDRLPAAVRYVLVTDVLAPVDPTGLAVVATSGSLALPNELQADERTVLCDSERQLAPYDREELRSILERRSGRAFGADALPDDALDVATETTLEAGGDAGYGLELLAAAGDLAVEEGTPRVRPGHVVQARERVAVAELADRLARLSQHHRLALAGVRALETDGDCPARVGPVFGAYADACRRAGVEPNTERSLQNYVRRLVEEGLLGREELRTDAGGRFNRYDLGHPAARIREALARTG